MRSDFKCPVTCEYHLKSADPEQKKLAINAKVDSKSELDELNHLIADYWMNHQAEELDLDIPVLMINDERKKQKLHHFLLSVEFPEDTKAYLFKRLGFSYKAQNSEKHFEDDALTYMELLLEGNFEEALKRYVPWQLSDNEYNHELLLAHFKSHHSIRKLSHFSLIASGMSAQAKEAFVSFELNNNQEFTLILTPQDNHWSVRYQAFGAVNLVRTENEALRFIAGALAKQEIETAYRYLTNYKQIYFFSADLYYYEGLYYSIRGEMKHAKNAYETAIALDPFFVESYYNLAFIWQAENKMDKAKMLYYQILKIKPDYLNALNNLGTICLFEKNVTEATKLFEKCLEIDPNYEYAQKNLEKIKEIF